MVLYKISIHLRHHPRLVTKIAILRQTVPAIIATEQETANTVKVSGWWNMKVRIVWIKEWWSVRYAKVQSGAMFAMDLVIFRKIIVYEYQNIFFWTLSLVNSTTDERIFCLSCRADVKVEAKIYLCRKRCRGECLCAVYWWDVHLKHNVRKGINMTIGRCLSFWSS